MNKIGKKIGIVALILCLATGCGNPLKKMTKSTVYIEKDGKVQSLSVESFEKEYYNEGELKNFIEKEIASQQKERGEDSVSIKEFAVKEKQAILQLQFAGLEDYQAFTDTEVESGAYNPEIIKSKQIDTVIEVGAKSKQAIAQIGDVDKLNYIFLKDPEGIQLLFDNQIKYCSENVTILDENLVSIPADEQCFILYETKR